MLSSLRGRITFAYVAFVLILYVIVAAVLAKEAVQFYVHNANESIDAAANQIRNIVSADSNETFENVASDITKNVSGTGLRIVGFQHPIGSHHFPGPMRMAPGATTVFVPMQPPGPPPAGPPPNAGPPVDMDRGTNRAIFSISNLAGIKAVHVDTPGASYFITADPTRLQTLLTSYAVLFFPGLLIFGLLGFGIGSYFAGQALSPLIAVTGALRRFAGGDFTPQHISTKDRSEIGNLAEAFNGAAAQVSAAFDERRRVEEYIRQFVADAGHELRTPLTVIRGYLDVLRRGAGDDPVKRERAFQTIEAETTRMRQLIEKLIVLARLERPEPSTPVRIDVSAVARNVAEAAGNVPGHPSIDLDLDDGAFVMADEAELHEAIANLVDNARKYGAGSPVRVEVQRTDSYVAVRVIDSGPGIAAEEQSHIFDRFYRGESQREIEGSGLGLAIAAQAVARAHGTLRLLESRPGNTVFEIKLPIASTEGSPSELVLGKKPKSRSATEPARP